MLMHGGSFNGAQILKPTVALMSPNHIGDINVNARVLKTTAPAISNDVDFGKLFPGQDLKWGQSFLINTNRDPRGIAPTAWRGAASPTPLLVRSELEGAGVLMSQILPFADPTVLGLSDQFERGVYKIAV
jgi:methyl acetate hydrolase